jgi:L-2-hydroxyglutarate oxidase
MDSNTYDIAVIGGGIVGLATALKLVERGVRSIVVLEAEDRLATHQTGHNSGVIHSGLYYRPGSLKARLCVAGREALYTFCAEHGVRHERCGKVVVATSDDEAGRLRELERRGTENGLAGMQWLGPDQVRAREPHVTCVAGLLVPQTGIVDYTEVCEAYASRVRGGGGHISTGARVRNARSRGRDLVLDTAAGAVTCRALVNCAGLQSDRVARACGVEPGVRIVPFRGEYAKLVTGRQHLVRHLIYSVPDPRFPFLGVHLTRLVHGGIEAGPNAVLAMARHGYTRSDLSPADVLDWLAFPGFWRMAGRHWRMAIGEMRRAGSRRAFAAELRRMVPELNAADLIPAEAGVRAQAVDRDGSLLDDFRIERVRGMVHVLNAPSPAATASLAIGGEIAGLAVETLNTA